jgi:hypothetical protein
MIQNELLLYRSLSNPHIVQYLSHILENPQKLAIATEYDDSSGFLELLCFFANDSNDWNMGQEEIKLKPTKKKPVH